MGEQTSGLSGRLTTNKLQTIGVARATISVELGADLVAQVAKRTAKYGCVLHGYDPDRYHWENSFLDGIAVVSEQYPHVAREVAQYLRQAVQQAAVQRALQQGRSTYYHIVLDACDVDLSGLDQAIVKGAEEDEKEHQKLEAERRKEYQRERWEPLSDSDLFFLSEQEQGQYYKIRNKVWNEVLTHQELEQCLAQRNQLMQLVQQRRAKMKQLAQQVGGELVVAMGWERGVFVRVQAGDVEIKPEEMDALTSGALLAKIWQKVEEESKEQMERIEELEQENEQLRQIIQRWCDLSKVPEVPDEETIQLARLARQICQDEEDEEDDC